MGILLQNWSLLLVTGLCLVGVFCSAWIVVPAPFESWLPLSVGAPEISPYLVGLNAIALLCLFFIKRTNVTLILMGCSTLALLLACLPLIQFSNVYTNTERAMQTGLGPQYLDAIPVAQRERFRSQPFALIDFFRGIPEQRIRQRSDIPFAQPEGVPLTLEIFQPEAPGQYPGIVSIYGGAWRQGTPMANADFNRYMAAQGYVVWAIDYRHAPEHRFPSQPEDVQTALDFIQDHAAEYETDPQRLALVGRSAGAHLAMLSAYSKTQPQIRAVVNYYGPVDLAAGYYDPPVPDPTDIRAILRDFLGGGPDQLPEVYSQASPITYVTRPLPPTLLIYGKRDHIVPAKYGRQMFQKLQAVNSQAVYLEIPWADHSFDAVFNGVTNQLVLYQAERFIAWALGR